VRTIKIRAWRKHVNEEGIIDLDAKVRFLNLANEDQHRLLQELDPCAVTATRCTSAISTGSEKQRERHTTHDARHTATGECVQRQQLHQQRLLSVRGTYTDRDQV
jgi:hypothetical protein